jgi:hypothetical protein
MTTPMHAEHTFACSAQTLVGLLSNPDFDIKLMAALRIGREVIEFQETPTGHRARLKLSPPTSLPGFMQSLVKSNHYGEAREWFVSDLRCDWRIEPAFAADKVDIKGVLKVVPTGDTSCKRIVDGTFSVRLPLIGGKVEAFIIKQTQDTFDQVAQFIHGYLRENNLT